MVVATRTFTLYLLAGILFLLALTMPLLTQPKSPSLRHLSVENGLSQNSVYCALQDRAGFLWFGTADGLNKFDGYEVTVYRHRQSDTNSLPSNTIRSLLEDRNGVLWINTDGGLCSYEKESGHFVRWLDAAWNEVLMEDHVGTLWVGASPNLLRRTREESNFHSFPFPPDYPKTPGRRTIRALAEDKKGNMWLGTQAGIGVIESGKLRVYPSRLDGTADMDDDISKIVVDPTGIFWLGTRGNGLIRFIPENGMVARYKMPGNSKNRSADDIIQDLSIDESGRILLATGTRGILRFDPVGGTFEPVILGAMAPTAFSTKNARCILRDRSGIYWFGTDGDGIYEYDPRPQKFLHFTSRPGDGNSLGGNFLKSVYEDSDGIAWIGAYGDGLTRWDRAHDRFTHFQTLSSPIGNLTGKSVFAICGDGAGNLWVGTDVGLFERSNRSGSFSACMPETGNRSVEVTALFLSRSGKLWIGTTTGLRTFGPKSKTLTPPPTKNINCRNTFLTNVTSLFEDKNGILWIGAYGGGLIRYDPGADSCKVYLHDDKNPSSLSSNIVKTILRDKDSFLWVGTDHGLNRLDPTSEKFGRFYEEDGLASSYIYGILEDDHGNLWLSSNKGIDKFNPNTRAVRNYGPEDGLQSNEFNTGAYFKNRNGEMYFGGINGLNLFHPDSIRDNPYVPQIALTGFEKLDQRAVIPGEPSELKEVRLNHFEDIFSFKFSGLEYTDPSQNEYAYMMEGYEKDWVYSGTRREVRYTHLDPGEYIFRAKCSNNDGVWNNAGMAIRVIIVPPFWRQWWFFSVVGIIAVAAVGGSIRYIELRRIHRRLEKLERERAIELERSRISRDMHDEIGSSLTKIAILGELVHQKLSKSEDALAFSEKISETARTVVDSMSEIIWAIDPKNDKLENLAAYIREHASEDIEMAGIICRFDFPDLIPTLNLSAEIRRNIFLTVKEAVHNIVKHSRATLVEFSLRFDGGVFELSIRDDGVGFTPEATTGSGNGLSNMRRRIEQIGGIFTLSSEGRKGTTIRIAVPLSPRKSDTTTIM